MFTLLSLTSLLCQVVMGESFYEVKPNKSDFPLPSEFPAIGERLVDDFDWKRYISEAKTEADRAYRSRVARWDYGQPVAGGGDSTSEDWDRARLAAAEFKSQCDVLIESYRKGVENEAEVLEDLNSYISKNEEAIAIQVKIIGGSWGGSGAKVAYARARMHGYLNFLRNLEALGESLYLQH